MRFIQHHFWDFYTVDENGCWNWTRSINSKGYGHFALQRKDMLAHRMAWILKHGPIPPGLCALHKCDNRRCINPDHLFLGTKSDNSLDASKKGRRYIIPKAVMRKGENHGLAKLTNEQALQIFRQYFKRKTTMRQLSKEFGVCPQTICNIIHGKTWSTITGVNND